MGRRQRRRRAGGEDPPAATTDYRDDDGNVLTLRDELSEATLRALRAPETRPGASAEDRSQRRTELLFERLAVRWEIAGLPLEGQRELLARYRMADADTRRWLRATLDRHASERWPGAGS